MTESKETKLLLGKESKQETDLVADYLTSLSEEERKAFLNFVQGARFAQQIQKTA
jgi:hypothetical protein